MKAATRSAIDARVRRLLQEMQIVNPPIDVDAIAKSLGVPIFREPLRDGISGLLYREAGKAAIFVNRQTALSRQRFTIAHELGHYLLDHKSDDIHVDKDFRLMFRSDKAKGDSQPAETQANLFAATLLMPKEMLESDLRRFGGSIDDGDILRLADRYGVSIQAFLIRLNSIDAAIRLSPA